MMRRLTPVILALALTTGAGASELPRVVSVNVCTDQLVLMLAEPEQIVSLSAIADSARSSSMADEARAFAKNNNRAESIAVQEPDVVVAGQWSDPALVNMLRSIDIEVVQFPLTASLAEIPDQIREMGRVLRQDAKAETLALEVEAELAARPDVHDAAPLAAFFFPNGFALGAGTLSHDILTAGGARNLSVDLGFAGNGRLSLEQVVLEQPDFLVGAPSYSGFSRSEEMTTHPSLEGFPMMHSSPDWVCGTPHALRAVADVAAMVEQFKGEATQ